MIGQIMNRRIRIILARSFAASAILLASGAVCAAPCPQDALGVRRSHDYAGYELALRHVWKHVDEVRRKLFGIMMEHHQVAKLSD